MKTKLLLFFAVVSLCVGAQTTHQLGWGNTGSDANQQLTIEVGDIVEWTWGSGTHNLVTTSGTETIDSGYHGVGHVFSYTFNEVGATDYVCSPHAGNMYGTVTVEEASAVTSNLSMQGVLDFSLPGKYFRGFHLKATADIADLSVYSMETYSSGDRLTANNTYTLSGSASAGDDILFWFSNAENAANIYMNASNIFDVVVDESANNWNGYNGDDPLTLSMNGTVVETYGELGVDGSGEAWEYTDTWAYKVDGAWTYGAVNCTDGSYYMWDSGCAYPLAIGQQATGASTDLVTAFSHDFHTMSQAGLWYNDGEAPIQRVTNNPADSDDAMMYTDDGSQAYSNMQIQFTSKVDMSSMNTFTVDVYVDGTTTTGTAPVNLALKLQDSSEGTPWTNQNVIIQDITADTWTTLTFAFNDDASMSRDDVDRIVVQFNGEGNNDQVVAYMKNMVGSYTEPVATLYTDVTFTVNTSTIEVGANGMYLGGGVIGSATAYAMTDADGDGTWEVTVSLEEGTTGNYIFLNSPSNESDWGTKEDLGGQECGDAANYNDRILAAVGADDYTLQHCFGNCYIDGTCGPVGPCDSALALTPGTTQTGNTSEWGDLFDDSTCLGSYDGGDDALFMYTATADGETLNVTVTGQAGWSGVAMSQGCPTEGGEVCVGSQTSSSREHRYKGLRAPHKIKFGVSGCTRECAEAQGKDIGIIATDNGWNLYVAGNGGMKPRHGDLFATDLDDATLVKYVDRILMFYVQTGDRLQRTSVWMDNLEGGLEYLQDVIINDSLGLNTKLEEQMAAIVGSYQCEWKTTIEDPEALKRFQPFVNSNQVDTNIQFVTERDQIRPARGTEKIAVTLIDSDQSDAVENEAVAEEI